VTAALGSTGALGRADAFLLAVALILAGCASRPPLGIDTLSGRMAVQIDGQPDRNVSGGFELEGNPRQGRLVLSGPLGTVAAQAEWSAGETWLVADGQRTRYDDLDALAVAALGESIPIAALFDWLRGQAWPGAPSTALEGGVAGFAQLGWRVDLSRWSEGWIEARRAMRPVVTVRARMERP
jgi:outer membrane lipoprotein LolB